MTDKKQQSFKALYLKGLSRLQTGMSFKVPSPEAVEYDPKHEGCVWNSFLEKNFTVWNNFPKTPSECNIKDFLNNALRAEFSWAEQGRPIMIGGDRVEFTNLSTGKKIRPSKNEYFSIFALGKPDEEISVRLIKKGERRADLEETLGFVNDYIKKIRKTRRLNHKKYKDSVGIIFTDGAAAVTVNGKIVFDGAYHDFHPGRQGTDAAGFEVGGLWEGGVESLAKILKRKMTQKHRRRIHFWEKNVSSEEFQMTPITFSYDE